MHKKLSKFFDQTSHPLEVDDKFHVFNISNSLNVIYWSAFFEMVEGLNFDLIVECGVGRGRSLITILSLEHFYSVKNNRAMKHIFAFDSFEGFPEPSLHDKSSRNPKKGDWAKSPSGSYEYSPEFIRKVLKNAGLSNLNHIKFFKGYFHQSIPKVKFESIGILHLDGDLYQSILEPLKLLWKYVIIGGLIILDDFILNNPESSKEDFPGARLAMNEFLAINDSFVLKESLRGSPYLMRIK